MFFKYFSKNLNSNIFFYRLLLISWIWTVLSWVVIGRSDLSRRNLRSSWHRLSWRCFFFGDRTLVPLSSVLCIVGLKHQGTPSSGRLSWCSRIQGCVPVYGTRRWLFLAGTGRVRLLFVWFLWQFQGLQRRHRSQQVRPNWRWLLLFQSDPRVVADWRCPCPLSRRRVGCQMIVLNGRGCWEQFPVTGPCCPLDDLIIHRWGEICLDGYLLVVFGLVMVEVPVLRCCSSFFFFRVVFCRDDFSGRNLRSSWHRLSWRCFFFGDRTSVPLSSKLMTFWCCLQLQFHLIFAV